MADSFIVESVFEIVESRAEEDEPELLHAEIKRAIPAKKITDFIIFGFAILSSEMIFLRQNYSRNYKAKELIIFENSHATVL